MHPLLQVKKLNIQFHTDEVRVNAINGVDLTVPAGRAVAIVGESGSGKSTVMMAVPRLLPGNAIVDGEILFDGRDTVKLSEKDLRALRGREIGVIFQNPTAYLNPTKTIGQQLIEPLLYHHMASAKAAKQQAISLLDQVGIADPEARFNMYPFEFSGGMLQRVMIAIALIASPKLLIADEPTTALDVTIQADILVLLKKLQRERGMSLVFVTHDLAVAAQLCDEVYVMYGGMVMEHLLVKSLVHESKHPYLRGLMQSIPRLDGPVERLPYIPGNPINTTQPMPKGCIFQERCHARMPVCDERPPLVGCAEHHEVACWLAQNGGIS
ncbi:ABC transporter ATP-binding protein [Alicyclobacillus fastidiosus]|uniref:ABC transporter ATP-binding protein n=1 Tax=Alicyclobacillus fastidiosus TaxID=392011 RepID=A0ABY6ZH21_9BACL|nr:ABC transporter ATP-binding protein [Alicyclobacillus fastidiosus]WAH41511.1 ABC transporter ATP-binding protein [Alicyclobacillus fastidiosus]GMA63160.1 peptide ABC transporter ATP-binding protein [Alicyclobacillus fastidiosus]